MIKEDLTGKKFNNWTVIKELGNGKVICQCDCDDKTIKELYKKAVKNGSTKSCGCSRIKHCRETKVAKETKYKGMEVKGWTVVSRVTNSQKLLCEDKHGNQRIFYESHFLRGNIACPGYKKLNDLTGKTINNWTVIEEIGAGKVKCRCNCNNKTEKIIYKSSLLNGKSKSCGCMSVKNCKETMINRYGDICTLKINLPREDWQIQVLNNKKEFKEFILALDEKPYIDDLCKLLSVNKSSIIKAIHKYEVDNLVKFMHAESYMEKDIYNLVSRYCSNIQRHCKNIIYPYELDIYIPAKRIAIEFNGNYWHSSIFKDKYYHQLKTVMCLDNNIHLIHISEYEWVNNRQAIERFIHNILNMDKYSIHEDDCIVQEIDNESAMNFEELYSIQGAVKSDINLGLYYNNELIDVMAINKSSNIGDYGFEITRLCCSYVLDGIKKLFDYFIDRFKPSYVLGYCDISKFTGNEYKSLGFKLVRITEPDYVLCDNHNNLKSKDEEDNTFKIYNSGIAEFIWKR